VTESDHVLVIRFGAEGSVDFFPLTVDSRLLSGRLGELVHFLTENPSVVRCAAGDHAHCPQ
jgi:hypothetical protein